MSGMASNLLGPYASNIPEIKDYVERKVEEIDLKNILSAFSGLTNEKDASQKQDFSLKDLECLRIDRALGDQVVNSYLEHVLHNPPAKKILILNNFFYSKLCLCLAPSGSSTTHRLVDLKRWWKNRSPVEEAYIIIPICENHHWTVAIICMPERVTEAGIPFLHFDSLPGSHDSDLILQNLESWLNQEWRSVRVVQTRNSTRPEKIKLVRVPINFPIQSNGIDCGIYAIYGVEKFIETAREKIKTAEDLKAYQDPAWIGVVDSSSLRSNIHGKLASLLNVSSAETPAEPSSETFAPDLPFTKTSLLWDLYHSVDILRQVSFGSLNKIFVKDNREQIALLVMEELLKMLIERARCRGQTDVAEWSAKYAEHFAMLKNDAHKLLFNDPHLRTSNSLTEKKKLLEKEVSDAQKGIDSCQANIEMADKRVLELQMLIAEELKQKRDFENQKKIYEDTKDAKTLELSQMVESWRKDFCISIFGLDESAKTSILTKLNLGTAKKITISSSAHGTEGNNRSISFFSAASLQTILSERERCFQKTQGLIFIVDSKDREKISEARTELDSILGEAYLEKLPLLVYPYNNDFAGALRADEIAEHLGLRSLEGGRVWWMEKDFSKGIDWLSRA